MRKKNTEINTELTEVKVKPKKLKKYALSSIRFLCQSLFVVVVSLIIVLFAFYLRILWKPINLEFLQPMLEYGISNKKFEIEIKKTKTINQYHLGLLGVEIEKIIIKNKVNDDTYILDDVILDISKISILQQEISINSVNIKNITLPKIHFNTQSSSTFKLKEMLKDVFSMPLLKSFENLNIQCVDGVFYVPQSKKDTPAVPMDITFSELKFERNVHYLTNTEKYILEYNFLLNNNPLPSIKINSGHIAINYDNHNQTADLTLKNLLSNRGNVPLAHIYVNFDTGYFKTNAITHNIYDGYFYKESIDLENIVFQGHFNQKTQFLNIQNYMLKFKDFLSITGDVQIDLKQGIDNFSYAMRGDIKHLTLERLRKLWSEKMAKGARAWVQNNLIESVFDTAQIRLSGKLSDENPKIVINAPIISSSFVYLKPMQPATKIKGRLILDNKKFTAKVDSGMIDVLNVKKTSFEIPDVFAPIPIGQVKSNMTGTLKPLLRLIDGKPLNLMSKAGFGYNHTVGNFTATLAMKLPLLKNVKLADIDVQTHINIKNASLNIGKKQLPLQKINADLFLTQNNAKGNGTVDLYGIKNQFNWAENFNLHSDVTTDLKLKHNLNHTQIQKLFTIFTDSNFRMDTYLQGNADLKTHIQLQNQRLKLLDIQGDATPMQFGDTNSLWHFRKNSPKEISLIAAEQNNQFNFQKAYLKNKNNIIHLSKIVIDKTGIKDMQIDLLNFKNIIRGLSGNYHGIDNRHFLKLNASKIFLQPIRDDLFKDDKKPTEIFNYPNVMVDLTVKKFKKSDDLTIHNAHILASRDIHNPHLMYLDVDSSMIDTTKIIINETAPDTRTIYITTQNAGRLFSGMGIFDDLEKGDLTMNLIQKSGITTGKMDIYKGTITKSPLIAKLLSLASLTGILDRLNNRGLSLDKTTVYIKKRDDTITFKQGTIRGSAIGLSFQGKHNLETKNMSIYGTLIPFYGINSILSDIPILGQIISSRKTEGLVGMSYKIDGQSDAPQISVNPLSILTPGILRRIFEQ